MHEETATGALRRLSPGWAWVRENFRWPSLLTIATLALAGAGSILQQRAELLELKRNQPKLEKISEQLSQVLQEQAGMREQLRDLGGQVDEQKQKWERVEEAAAIRIPRRRR